MYLFVFFVFQNKVNLFICSSMAFSMVFLLFLALVECLEHLCGFFVSFFFKKKRFHGGSL